MSQEPTATKTVEASDRTTPDADPWRYRCPNGHASWVGLATSARYYCKTCDVRFGADDLLDLRDEDTSVADFGGGR